MLNLPVIITPLRTYLYGQTSFWMEVICLQHLLIEYLENYNFLKIANANSIFVDVKSKIQLSCQLFFCQREIIWVRKTICFVFFQLIQYIHFIFDPKFDNRILGMNQRVHNILFAVRGIWQGEYLILDRRQFALFSFSLRFCKWYLNVKCSSSINPRYLVWEVIFIFTYSKVDVFGKFFAFRCKLLFRTSSILPEFRDILFDFSHSIIEFRSRLIFLCLLRNCLHIVYLYLLQNYEFLRNYLCRLGHWYRSRIEVDQVPWHSVIYIGSTFELFCLC